MSAGRAASPLHTPARVSSHARRITVLASDPIAVWEQFCEEAAIAHTGLMFAPPQLQGEVL